MITNAKEEFFEIFFNEDPLKVVKCVEVTCQRYYAETIFCDLKLNYSVEDFEKFLKSMDFEYDSGSGTQELFGTIWFNDGTWAERSEYDGAESWEYKKPPEIPDYLK